jgi:hypothetical protein
MTAQRRAAEQIDRYFDALARDPHAAPPPGLDAESAAIVRAVVAEQRRTEDKAALAGAQARVWERVGVRARPSRLLFPLAALSLAAALLLALVLRPGQSSRTENTTEPRAPEASELVARAQAALGSPVAAGLSGLLVTESTAVQEPGGGETRTRTERAFQAPDR